MDISTALSTVLQHPDFRVLQRVPESLLDPVTDDADSACLLLVDTETTGLNKTQDKIIEIGLLLLRYQPSSGRFIEVMGQYSGLEDPGQALSSVVQTVTGLTDQDLAGQQIDDHEVERLAQQAQLVVAHNAAFDRPFLQRRWPLFADLSFACSVNEIDWLRAGFTSAKLELLSYHAGRFYDGHRALNDCWALLFVLSLLLEPDGETALAQLLRNADSPSFLLNLQVAFDNKEALKAIGGFQWQDGTNPGYLAKSWLRVCRNREELRSVLQQIQANVFAGQSFPCCIGKQTARERYAPGAERIVMKPYRFPDGKA